MKIHKRLLLLGAGAALALGTLTACGGDSPQPSTETTTGAAATTTTTAPAMPESATYIAELEGQDEDYDDKIYLAINVEGENVVAYACNNVDDAAWFFGTQRDGAIDLTSEWQDNLTAQLDGTNLVGALTMNLPDAKPMSFTASPEPEPAGMYTATEGDARASWVVMDDGRIYGVMQPNSRRDRELIKKIQADQQNFQTQVRQARIDLQKQQAPALNMTNRTSNINGRTVKATQVDANMRSLPDSN